MLETIVESFLVVLQLTCVNHDMNGTIQEFQKALEAALKPPEPQVEESACSGYQGALATAAVAAAAAAASFML